MHKIRKRVYGIRQRILDMSIRKKLMYYSYLAVTPILLLISVTLVVRNYGSMEDSRNLTQMQSVQSLEDNVDVLRNDMQNICTYLCINEDITQILRSPDADTLNQNFQLWLDEAPMNIVLDMIALKGFIKTIAIYPENGVNPYLRCLDSSAHISTMAEIKDTVMYKRAVNDKGTIFWKREDKNQGEVYQANRSEKLVLYREIYDIGRKTQLGYLVIGSSTDTFYDLCKNVVQMEDEGILIFSPQGELLFQYGSCNQDLVKELEIRQIWNNKRGERQEECEGYDLYLAQNEKASFIVCKIVPKVSFSDLLKQSVPTPLILLVVMLIGFCPVLLFISAIITKPLNRLTTAMAKFKEGDFTQKIPVQGRDEIGVVSDGFNDMVKDIRELIDTNYVMALQEKESELNALQAQINPHFLYNTLDALYWRANENENDEVAEDILALSKLFRLVLGQGKGIVLVRDEVELVRSYLQVQKMRFEKKLEYSITVEKEMELAGIPKLILQPFVENAIVHGFENVGTRCGIYVEGHLVMQEEQKYLQFMIKDTGQGMTKEQLDEIWNIDDTKRYASQRVGHYAIKNVKERLALKYHNDFVLKIESELGKGTCITIIIPYEEGSAEDVSEFTDC